MKCFFHQHTIFYSNVIEKGIGLDLTTKELNFFIKIHSQKYDTHLSLYDKYRNHHCVLLGISKPTGYDKYTVPHCRLSQRDYPPQGQRHLLTLEYKGEGNLKSMPNTYKCLALRALGV